MANTIVFKYENYIEALKRGECEPPLSFAPFIRVDRSRFDSLREKGRPLGIGQIKKRLGSKTFEAVRGAVSLTLRRSRCYFPAFRHFYGEFLNDEWLAAVDWHKGFHRDHVVHQPMSFYVGKCLLKGNDLSGKSNFSFNPGGGSLLDKMVETIFESPRCSYLLEYLRAMGAPEFYIEDSPFGREMWKDIILDTFFLASMFHDIGYPWSLVNKIHAALDDKAPLDNPYAKGASWLAQRFGQRLLFYPFNGYKKTEPSMPDFWPDEMVKDIKDGLTKTHGLPGAVAMLHLNDMVREFPAKDDRPVRRFCVEWAAMAVMMHDLSGLYCKVEKENGGYVLKPLRPHLRLSFRQDPLSFIMTLTDLIEDFGRYDADFKSYGENQSKAEYFNRCKRVELQVENDILKITYFYNTYEDFFKNKAEFIPQNCIKFCDPSVGYLDFSGSGISGIELYAEMDTSP